MAGDSYHRPLKGMHKVIILVTQTSADILTMFVGLVRLKWVSSFLDVILDLGPYIACDSVCVTFLAPRSTIRKEGFGSSGFDETEFWRSVDNTVYLCTWVCVSLINLDVLLPSPSKRLVKNCLHKEVHVCVNAFFFID